MNIFKRFVNKVDNTVEDQFIDPLELEAVRLAVRKSRKRTLLEENKILRDNQARRVGPASLGLDPFYFEQANPVSKQLARSQPLTLTLLGKRVKELETKLLQLNASFSENFKKSEARVKQALSLYEGLTLKADALLPSVLRARKSLCLAKDSCSKVAKIYRMQTASSHLQTLLGYLKEMKQKGYSVIGSIVKFCERPELQTYQLMRSNLAVCGRLQPLTFELDSVARLNQLSQRAEHAMALHLQQVFVRNIRLFKQTEYSIANYCFVRIHGQQHFRKYLASLFKKQARAIKGQAGGSLRTNQFFQQLVIILTNLQALSSWHYSRVDPQDEAALAVVLQTRSSSAQTVLDQAESYLEQACYTSSRQVFCAFHYCSQFYRLAEQFVPDCSHVIDRVFLAVCKEHILPAIDKARTAANQYILVEEEGEWSKLPLPADYFHSSIKSLLFMQLQVQQSIAALTKNEAEQFQYLSVLKADLADLLAKAQQKAVSTKQVVVQFQEQRILCQTALSLIASSQAILRLGFLLPPAKQIAFDGIKSLIQFYLAFLLKHFLDQSKLQLLTDSKSQLYKLKDGLKDGLNDSRRAQLLRRAQTLVDTRGRMPVLAAWLQKPFPRGQFRKSRQERRMIRSRIISLQSLKGVLAHLRCFYSRVYPERIPQLDRYCCLVDELKVLLYQDVIKRVANLQAHLADLQLAKWDGAMPPSVEVLLAYSKDLYHKIRATIKGELALTHVQDIFKHYVEHLFLSLLSLFCQGSIPVPCALQLLELFSRQFEEFFPQNSKVPLYQEARQFVQLLEQRDEQQLRLMLFRTDSRLGLKLQLQFLGACLLCRTDPSRKQVLQKQLLSRL